MEEYNQSSSINRKIIMMIFVLCGIGVVWFLISKTTEYYNGIRSGTIDFTQIASKETSQISGSAQNESISTVAHPRLLDFTQDPAIGNASAPVQIVMFADFECPYCQKVFAEVKAMLALRSADVYFVYRDFPITDIHPGAFLAAEAAQCAHDQDKFWPYHDKLYLNAGITNTAESLKLFARQLNLDTTAFDRCLDNHVHEEEVRKDYEDALALGVTGTPTFFFNGNKVPGVITKAGFDQIIDYLKAR